MCAAMVTVCAYSRDAQATTIIPFNVWGGDDANSWLKNVAIDADPYSWTSTSFDIYGTLHPGTLLAHIDRISVTLEEDPQMLLGLAVAAGAVDTNFTISSSVVKSSPIPR